MEDPTFFQFLKEKRKKLLFFRRKDLAPGSQSAISRTQKTHVQGVDIPEHDGEIGSTLGGRKNPEYRFGGPGMLIFEGKRHKKTFFCFLTGFCGLICNA